MRQQDTRQKYDNNCKKNVKGEKETFYNAEQ